MREIKFRAFKYDILKEKFRMYEWDSIKDNCMAFFTNPEKFTEFVPNKKPPIIMQFTGLKDKNGVEIYEGDIVNFFFVDRFLDIMKYTKQVVVYENQMFSARFPIHKVRDIEVIGNIHSNPELLDPKTITTT